MTEYIVEITSPVERDLTDILVYITETLKEPETARRIYAAIKREILTLSALPQRHSVVDEPPYAEMGIRRLFVENYAVFYSIDAQTRTVRVLRVLYNRREWQHILGV